MKIYSDTLTADCDCPPEELRGIQIRTERISRRDDGRSYYLHDPIIESLEDCWFDVESIAELRGCIYRAYLGEEGRCISKIYVDTDDGPKHVGYCFEARRPFEDDPSQSSIIETWVTVEKIIEPAHPATLARVALS